MLDTLILKWQSMQPRERRVIVVAALVLLAALLYLLVYEPAAEGRRKVRRELPQLRAQVAQMDAMVAEAKRLGRNVVGVEKPEQLREQLARSVEATGLKPNLAELKLNGELIDMQFKAVPFGAWLAWFEAAQRETRVRAVDVAISRQDAAGLVDVRAALEPPRPARR